MRVHLSLVLASLVATAASAGAATITYTGSGGASATAQFTLVGSTLEIVLTNTSVWPGGTAGGAALVLSSLNIDLPDGVAIAGGSVSLPTGSALVAPTGKGADRTWGTPGTGRDLNVEYAYSNDGIGNPAGSPGVLANARNAVTSHDNGSARLRQFAAGTRSGGGLDPGILSTTTPVFGNGTWVMESLRFTLLLNGTGLQNLDFLRAGSYVEFGSDAQFAVGGACDGLDCPPVDTVPEPTTAALVGLALLAAGFFVRRSR